MKNKKGYFYLKQVKLLQAFNTFIDDLFAFIITMPTTHRIACFRFENENFNL